MQVTVNNNNAFKTRKHKQYVIVEQKLPPIPFNPVKYKAPMLCIQVIAPKLKQLLKELRKALVFPNNMSHIKRIRRLDTNIFKPKIDGGDNQILEVLLCKKFIDENDYIDDEDDNNTKQFQSKDKNKTDKRREMEVPINVKKTLKEINASTVYIINVPTQKPQNKNEFEIGKKIWPMSYHQGPDDNDLEIKSESFINRVTNYMNYAIKLKELAIAQAASNSNDDNAEDKQGVIFVDPDMNAIVSQSFYNNTPSAYKYVNHPLDNPVMRCIRQISFRDTTSKDLRDHYFEQNVTQQEEGNNNKNHDTSVNGNTEKKKKRKWSKNIENNNSNNSSRTKKAKCTKQFTTLSSYLCTGYDVYMTNEPNTFTAMAMLHSRVGRVFYFDDDEKYGVVSNNTSKVQLHTLKGINHRFRVFKLT